MADEENKRCANDKRPRLQDQPDYHRERFRRWRKANSKHHAERNNAWYHKNKEKVLAKEKLRREKNRDAIRTRRAGYHVKNAAKNIARVAAWRKANPDKKKAQHQIREARKLALPADFTGEDVRFALEYWNNQCATCDVPLGLLAKTHWDHWISLNCPTCPGTVLANMLPLCEHCNTTKHDEPPEQWLKRKFGARRAAIISRKIIKFFASVRPSAIAA